jgi:hypothetical protein
MKNGVECQAKKTTGYGGVLFILLSANRARRRILIISNSSHAYSVKKLGC